MVYGYGSGPRDPRLNTDTQPPPSTSYQFYGPAGYNSASAPQAGATRPPLRITSPSAPLALQNRPADWIGARAQKKSYQDQAIKDIVNKIMPHQKAAKADTNAAYNTEVELMRKLMEDQRREAERERNAQLALDRQRRTSAYKDVAKQWERIGLDGKEITRALRNQAESASFDPTDAQMVERVRETKTWNKRFGSVINAREKAGRSFYDEAHIVGMEDGFKRVMSDANMPKGFYDSHKDFEYWIANDISVDEIGERVSIAERAINNQDPDYVKAMKQMYGVKRSDLAAYMLDRKRGVEVLEQQYKAVELGAEALETGINVTTKFAEELVDKGIGREQARRDFGTVAVEKEDWQRLAAVSGEDLTEKSLVNAELGLSPNVEKKKNALASKERARWGGSGGSGGAFNGSGSGSY